jgi:hypothetical protein
MVRWLALSCLGLSVMSSAAASGSLLANGGFEADDASANPYYIRYTGVSSPTGWTQFGDGVDLIHDTYTQGPSVLVQPYQGDQFIDLNAAGLYGGLRQEVSVSVGQAYELSLWLSQWATNSAGTVEYALVDGVTELVLNSGTYDVTTAAGWTERRVQAIATSNELRVVIRPIAGVWQAGPGLDEVSLVAVPEPASWGVVAAAGGLLLRRRRSR